MKEKVKSKKLGPILEEEDVKSEEKTVHDQLN